ncbi:PIN domain-like protein, partial [Mycena amicta]
QILQPASTTHTLRELATRRGFERDNRDARSFLVGVDIGVRVAAIQKNRFNRRFHHVNERNILITFFYQLCSFQRCSATFIFVFDGPGCPRIKRGTQVRMNSSTLIMNLKKLIAAFGYYSHDAPGEAEAELAYLNKFGHIDAILTTDGDVFAFGGLCIIQMNGSKVDEEVPLYEAATFISSPLNLDEAGIILVALLAGGDYDQGIAGCSAEISHRLAKAGFGTTLHTIVTTHTGDTLQYRLEKWRQSIRAQLVSNPSGLLDRRHPQVASRITAAFPDLRVFNLYAMPTTSWSPHVLADLPDTSRWIPLQPNIARISTLCSDLFHWGTNIRAESESPRINSSTCCGLVLLSE